MAKKKVYPNLRKELRIMGMKSHWFFLFVGIELLLLLGFLNGFSSFYFVLFLILSALNYAFNIGLFKVLVDELLTDELKDLKRDE